MKFPRQHEIDFRFAICQDSRYVTTLKYTVKAIAAQHDLVTSFMPKPISASTLRYALPPIPL
jgi:glutamine synthetase